MPSFRKWPSMQHRWTFEIVPTELGPTVLSGRRAHRKTMLPAQFPPAIVEFMNLTNPAQPGVIQGLGNQWLAEVSPERDRHPLGEGVTRVTRLGDAKNTHLITILIKDLRPVHVELPEISPSPENYDGSHCGLHDLYPAFEKKLKAAWRSRKPFRTTWCSKKEIVIAWMRWDGEMLELGVHQSMDEGAELVDDAFWQACVKRNWTEEQGEAALHGRDRGEFCNAIYDMEMDAWDIDSPVNSDAEESDEIERPRTMKLEEALEKIDALWDRTDKELKDRFEHLVETVGYYLDDADALEQLMSGVDKEEDDE